MDKERLFKLLDSEPSDIDAIGMILSNHTDYGHSELGGMVSVKQFNVVAEWILEWFKKKQPSIIKEATNVCKACNSDEVLDKRHGFDYGSVVCPCCNTGEELTIKEAK